MRTREEIEKDRRLGGWYGITADTDKIELLLDIREIVQEIRDLLEKKGMKKRVK